MKKRAFYEQEKRKAITANIHGYYFCSVLAGIILFLSSLSHLFILEIAAPMSAALTLSGVAFFVGANRYYGLLKKGIPENTTIDLMPQFYHRRLAVTLVIIVLLMLSIHPLIDFYARAAIAAAASSLISCWILWQTKAYRKAVTFLNHTEE